MKRIPSIRGELREVERRRKAFEAMRKTQLHAVPPGHDCTTPRQMGEAIGSTPQGRQRLQQLLADLRNRFASHG